MAQRETLLENTAGMWLQQVDQWLESTNWFREQMEALVGLWGKQVTEAQKETQKFIREWASSMAKSQADLLRVLWQARREEGGQVSTQPAGSR